MKLGYRMKILFVIIFFLSGLYISAQQGDRSAYFQFGDKLFYEAYANQSGSKDSINIAILMKFSKDAITYTLHKDAENKDIYAGYVDFEAECRDSEGIIRKRIFRTDTIICQTYEETAFKHEYFSKFMTFRVLKGKYELKVKSSITKGKNDFKPIAIDYAGGFYEKPTYGRPIPCFFNADGSYSPVISGGNISFSSSNSGFLMNITYNPSAKKQFYYRIKRTKANKLGLQWAEELNYDGNAILEENTRIAPDKGITEANIRLRLDSAKQQLSNFLSDGVLKLPFPSEKIFPGGYTLEVIRVGSPDTVKFDFEVIWETMPLSLRKIDYALKMLNYILDDKEYDALTDGNESEKYQKLLQYWIPKDPTPTTPFNEAMFEYFRRVDYAFFNFQSVSQKDGADTDRGKIYILNGKPGSVERNLVGDKSYELWAYDKMKKVYTFELVSNGNFKLISIKDIK
jgi:GWxTD domain-containing protein